MKMLSLIHINIAAFPQLPKILYANWILHTSKDRKLPFCFFGGGPIVLPRHLLLIDGQVVEPFAPGPGDLRGLEEKLRGY
jgi:hypothetical protein